MADWCGGKRQKAKRHDNRGWSNLTVFRSAILKNQKETKTVCFNDAFNWVKSVSQETGRNVQKMSAWLLICGRLGKNSWVALILKNQKETKTVFFDAAFDWIKSFRKNQGEAFKKCRLDWWFAGGCLKAVDKHVVADGRRRKHLSANLQTKMGDIEGKYGRCLGRGGARGRWWTDNAWRESVDSGI